MYMCECLYEGMYMCSHACVNVSVFVLCVGCRCSSTVYVCTINWWWFECMPCVCVRIECMSASVCVVIIVAVHGNHILCLWVQATMLDIPLSTFTRIVTHIVQIYMYLYIYIYIITLKPIRRVQDVQSPTPKLQYIHCTYM